MKKLLSLFSLFFLALPSAFAASVTIDSVTYQVLNSTKTATIVSYSQPSNTNVTFVDLVIPSTVTSGGNTYTVTKISTSAFAGNSKLRSVSLPNTITEILDNAFYKCSGMEKVNVPSGVKTINSGTFACYNNGNLDVELEEGLECIKSGAFVPYHGTIKLTLPSTVKRVEGLGNNVIVSNIDNLPSSIEYWESCCNATKAVFNGNMTYCDVPCYDSSPIDTVVFNGRQIDTLVIYNDYYTDPSTFHCTLLSIESRSSDGVTYSSFPFYMINCDSVKMETEVGPIVIPALPKTAKYIGFSPNESHFAALNCHCYIPKLVYNPNVKYSFGEGFFCYVDSLIIPSNVTNFENIDAMSELTIFLSDTTLYTNTNIFTARYVFDLRSTPQIKHAFGSAIKYNIATSNPFVESKYCPLDSVYAINPVNSDSWLYVLDENAYNLYKDINWCKAFNMDYGIPDDILDAYYDVVPLVYADKQNKLEDDNWYDIMGRKVNLLETGRVYVHKGKKILYVR